MIALLVIYACLAPVVALLVGYRLGKELNYEVRYLEPEEIMDPVDPGTQQAYKRREVNPYGEDPEE